VFIPIHLSAAVKIREFFVGAWTKFASFFSGYVESVSHETVRQTLKKRTPALSAGLLGNSAWTKRRVCLSNRVRAGTLPTAHSPRFASGVAQLSERLRNQTWHFPEILSFVFICKNLAVFSQITIGAPIFWRLALLSNKHHLNPWKPCHEYNTGSATYFQLPFPTWTREKVVPPQTILRIPAKQLIFLDRVVDPPQKRGFTTDPDILTAASSMSRFSKVDWFKAAVKIREFFVGVSQRASHPFLN